jgi:hypothetical protein
MTFQALKASLEGSSFLGAGLANLVKTHSVEQLLDARDVREFDALWTAANAAVEAAAEKVDSDDNPYEVSRLAYAAAFDATGSGDLAGYVSDDFELLGRALASHASSDFLCALWTAYASGDFPRHPLRLVSGDLKSLVTAAAADPKQLPSTTVSKTAKGSSKRSGPGGAQAKGKRKKK